MTNLIDIQGQIEKLQKQANDIRSKEFDKTIQEILTTMQAFGITTKDLNAVSLRPSKTRAKGTASRKTGSRPGSTAGSKVAPKFRGPNGETWSGRGLSPRWLSALVAQGREKDEFAVKD